MSKTIPICAALSLLLLVACANQQNSDYLRPVQSQVDQAYVKPGVDFSKYHKLMNGGLGIYYPDNAAPPSEAELQRIRTIFKDAFRDAVIDEYEVVEQAGPDVLEVRAQIIDMKIAGATSDYTAGGRLRDLVARGELTFLMELRDSISGETLARAGDKTTDISASGDQADWDDIDRAANYWASLFRVWLDKSLGTSRN
ncbi:MAG TPA: DUF3313 family protein [Woeseiaceae bacterium]|nr:DUF3313 family protein [Woeseiaceae bacterium]